MLISLICFDEGADCASAPRFASVMKAPVLCTDFREEDYVAGDGGVQEGTSKDHIRQKACVDSSAQTSRHFVRFAGRSAGGFL